MIKAQIEIIEDLFGKRAEIFTKNDMIKSMSVFANQFRWIKTTCGKNIEFDDLDYEVLRQQPLFFDNRRKTVSAVWVDGKKKIVAPVAKLMLDAEGKTIIHYKDKNPLNLKRDNIQYINRKVASQKQSKARTANGNEPTSIYKGVSWSKFAKKWCAYIKIDFAKKHLGYFLKEEDAAKAYNEFAKENWGEDCSKLNILP